MRDFQQLIRECRHVVTSGVFPGNDELDFTDGTGVVLPLLTDEEEEEHWDALVEYWHDRDVWDVFDHGEDIVGHEAEGVDGWYRITSYDWTDAPPVEDETDADGSVNGVGEVRHCNACGKGMQEGFCIEGGIEYYCSKVCLNTEISDEEFDELYDDGEGDSYWTEWYDGE